MTAPDDAGRVAIVGMAGRFPGAPDVAALWDGLVHGREGVRSFTADELRAAGVPAAELARDGYVPAKGVLDDADRFDAGFFGFSPREAEALDPQHRVLLECAWTALESAGCDPRRFGGRIGVFAGASMNSYLLFNLLANPRAVESIGSYQALIASDKDFLATRVSYKLGLTGPSVTVQTACSTSLTAVHLACQSLLAGECDLALAGGVSVSVPLTNGYRYEPGGIMAPDGHCRAFDADAAGTVAGNGVGLVVLRRLADARADGDPVTAVIRGTAVNNDGAVKAGYTAPGVDGQAEVIAEALAVADVDAGTVGFVEAHGTGTPLGDPIEVAALTRAFREHTDRTGYCALGSVKSSVGHLDAAAGVTSLIKAALAVRHGVVPPTLHHRRPNPALELAGSPFFVNAEAVPWPGSPDGPRRAGVSSFGIGGSNVHVVLEEAPPAGGGGPGRPVQVLPLSARTGPALVAAAGRLADHLEQHPDLDLADVAWTLAGRRAFEHRAALAVRDRAGAIAALRRLPAGGGHGVDGPARPVAFLFPGQGAQHPGMAADLYAAEPVFAAELDRCIELVAGQGGPDLRPLLLDRTADPARLDRTEAAQPALFAVGYALAQLWLSWGVRPRAVAGHSVGEYVAACLAGVLTLPDAVRLVTARGRLVQSMPAGSMLAVPLPEAETAAWLGPDLTVAAANSTALTVVAGPEAAVADLHRRLTAAGVGSRPLHTSHAFHSPTMDAAVGPFAELVRQVTLAPPRLPLCSAVTGTWLTDAEATDPDQWAAQLRRPVRFAAALATLLADPELVLLEAGPGRTLATFARQHAAWTAGRTVVGSLPHPEQRHDGADHALAGLGELWAAGVPVEWAGRFAGERRRRVELPGYPFQRERYWIDPEPVAGPAGTDAGPLESGVVVTAPGWRRLPPVPAATPDPAAAWVVLGTDVPLGAALADRLAAAGATVVRVRAASADPAGTDRTHGAGERTLDPADRGRLAELLGGLDAPAIRVVHAWSLAGDEPGGSAGDRLVAARRRGFDSLLALAQALGDARPAAPVGIDVLCRGVHSVTGTEPLRPEQALLLGPATVIPQEVPGVTCRSLDLDGSEPDEELLASVVALLARPPAEPELARRGRHWWVAADDAVELAPVQGGHPRDGGVYLITGGLGGLGAAFAEHLARAATAPVLGLLGRTPPPPDDPRLRRLEELGARVAVLTADVTDLAQTRQAVAGLRERYGRIEGVVHAAGSPSRGLIAGKTAAEADAVLAAKTRGTLVLDEVCREDRPDFVLLCSSLTAVLGGPGQSDYAAANAFLDAFARAARRSGAPVTAVAWDTWRGVGMAAGLPGGPGRPTGHPLLRLVDDGAGSRTYVTTLSTADSWVVDEHRIQGHGLVPGTTYLELVHAAVAEQAAGRVVELTDVLFTLPVIVPDGQTRELHTTVAEQEGGGLRFAVRSRAGAGGPAAWQEHAGGTVTFADRHPEPVRDLDQLRRDCEVTEVLETEDELSRRLKLDRVAAGGPVRFDFGPRWRCLRRIEAGSRRMLVTLRLADEFHADLDGYALHPALLDVAGAAARIAARDVYYLPLTYRSVRVHAPLTGTVHCLVEPRPAGDSGETLSCDLDLLDPDGRLLVQITGFTIKRINDPAELVAQIERAAAGPGPEPAAGPLETLARGISARDGVDAFARLVAAAPRLPDQVAVCGRDLGVLRRLARSITPELLVRELAQAPPLAASHPRPDLATPYVPPETGTERAVAEIWQDVLGVDRVGVQDDFFALGGHSLAAVQIGAKIQSRFQVQLELRDFFDGPTVARTAAALAAGGSGGSGGSGGDGAQDRIEVLTREAPPDGLDGLSDDEVDAMLRSLLTAEPDRQGDTA